MENNMKKSISRNFVLTRLLLILFFKDCRTKIYFQEKTQVSLLLNLRSAKTSSLSNKNVYRYSLKW